MTDEASLPTAADPESVDLDEAQDADDKRAGYLARLNEALAADLPHVYANGFVTASSNGDILTVLELNGKPVAILNTSFTITKSLALSLGMAISRLEEQSGREIMTSKDIRRMFASSGGESDAAVD